MLVSSRHLVSSLPNISNNSIAPRNGWNLVYLLTVGAASELSRHHDQV